MASHDRIVHFLGISADIRHDTVRVIKGKGDAPAKHPTDPVNQVRGEPTSGKDATEGNRQAGLRFPRFAEVGDLNETLFGVGKPILMDDHARINFSAKDEILDLVKDAKSLAGRTGKISLKQQVCGCPPTRKGNGSGNDFFPKQGLAGNDKRAAAPAQGGSGIQQFVSLLYIQRPVKTQLCDIQRGPVCKFV